MTDVLGDGDNIILGARLPEGREISCVIYIDHNVGTLVKDAFVISEPFATVVAKYQEVTEDLLDSLLWYGTDYGNGDPMRWSPVKVELLLANWLPRKIVTEVQNLALAPDLLRASIRFAHTEVGLRPDLTTDALNAIDAWEPEYQRIIRSPRLQGPEALLAAMGIGNDGTPFDDPAIARRRVTY